MNFATSVSSSIANAATQIESNLRWPPGFDYDLERTRGEANHTDLPEDRDADEVVEPASISVGPNNDELEQDETYRSVLGGVADKGIEYLAFYKSFRFAQLRPAKNHWGIFIIKQRFSSVVKDIQLYTGYPYFICAQLLFEFILTHERYHYKIDAYSLQLESTGGAHLYRPYRSLVEKLSIDYWYEEAVANSYALARLRQIKKYMTSEAIYEYLWHLVDSCPGAYAGGTRTNQVHNKSLIAEQIAQPHATSYLNNNHVRPVLEATFRMGTNFSFNDPTLGSLLHIKNCPVYWIDWQRGGKSILMAHAVSLSEMKGFILKYLDGKLERFTDHGHCKIDNGERVKVPNPHKKDISQTEFKNIISKAGLTDPQFFKARNKTKVWTKNIPRNPILPPRNGFS